MGFKKFVKKYNEYESTELTRRLAKKRKLGPYKTLASRKKKAPKRPPLRMTARGITKAIDNPYGVKFPKAKKVLKKTKKKKLKQRTKTVVVYR